MYELGASDRAQLSGPEVCYGDQTFGREIHANRVGRNEGGEEPDVCALTCVAAGRLLLASAKWGMMNLWLQTFEIYIVLADDCCE